MIRNVIFDMGMVLIQWFPEKIAERTKASEEDIKLLCREVFGGFEWYAMDHGIMTQEEGLSRIYARLPERLHGAAKNCVCDWWKDELTFTEGIEKLIRELKSNGYGLYILTNATSSVHEYFNRLPASDCFDGIVVSADYKMMKPERGIYEKLFEKYSLKPSECFFIDDNAHNIEGAYNAGMAGTVFFQDMQRLRKELKCFGITVSSDE